MASLHGFWSRLLRAFGAERLRGHWVEPGNAVTRAIAAGTKFATMNSWEGAAPGVPRPAQAASAAARAGEPQEETASRKGVAA